MEQTLLLLGVLLVVVSRVIDGRALRALDPEARSRVDVALFRSRAVGLAVLVAALVVGVVAWAMELAVAPTVLVFALVLASVVVQTVLGVLALRETDVPPRYKAVFLASRFGTLLGLVLLLAPTQAG